MMTRPRRDTRLALERLESRDTPAGTVAATFSGGGLVVTGDAADNSLTIFTAADQLLRLQGVGTLIRLNRGPAVTTVILPDPVAGGVTIRLGGGSDQLVINGVDLPGPLTVSGGAGGNAVSLNGGVRVNGNLAITHGPGFDMTQFNGPVSVTGGLTIANGDGGSLVMDTAGAGTLRVTGALAVTGGSGADTVEFDNMSVVSVGRLLVGGGAGVNTMELTPGELTVATAVRVTGGAAKDDVFLRAGRTTVGGGITVNTGAGPGNTQISGTAGLTVGGGVSVTSADGPDAVAIGQLPAPTTIGGGLAVDVGEGGSGIEIQASLLTVGGPVRVSGRAGTDFVGIHASQGGVVGGAVAVTLGTGLNQQVDIRGDLAGTGQPLSIGGGLRVATADATGSTWADLIRLGGLSVGLGTTITTGAADDKVVVDDSVFGGPVAVSTGGGGDRIEIELAGTGGATWFLGAVRVSTGAGDDEVRVGNNSTADRAVFAAAGAWDGGAGANDKISLGNGNVIYGPFPDITGFESMT
jgi:hypothetical protein